ncbi:MAG: metal-dependent transcriptional regulator [Coriobacteriales bacterium]|jgi:Mn-dependent DtxR family transcriptional regulator|nr:metal-dependent transcriptional regulator [Coriobacteriales bacterium]
MPNSKKIRLSSAGEDYLQAIYLLAGTGSVRSVDVATRMDVSKASVNNAVKTLVDAGLVTKQHYGEIELTPVGREHAEAILDRHRVLYHFLIDQLGVDPYIAAKETDAMEHAISEHTLELWRAYLIKNMYKQK